jgi:hypothetical protein
MSQTDISSNILHLRTVSPQVVTAGSVTGATCDLQLGDSAMFFIAIGAIVASGLVTIALQESDDNFSTNNVIAAADLIGSVGTLVQDTVQKVGYRGAKRYIRAVVTYVSGTSVAVAVTVGVADLTRRPNPMIA